MADERAPLSDLLKEPQDSPKQSRPSYLDPVSPYGLFDDSATIAEAQRRNAFGRPSVRDLQDREMLMEQQLQRPLTPDQLFPSPRPHAIQLQPVEHNPHNPFVVLEAVDYDPWGKTN